MHAAWAAVVFAFMGAFVGALRCVIHWRKRGDMPNLLEFLTATAWAGVCGVVTFGGLLIILRAAGLYLT